MTNITIPPERVNVLESDIEDWLFNNPQRLADVMYSAKSITWLSRQLTLPSGKLDLLGVMESSYLKKNWLFVAEIKNVPLRAEHLTQVCRYAADIDTVCEYFEVNYGIPLHLGETTKVIIFPDSNFDSKLQYEADALGIILHSFNVQLNLSLTGQWGWNGKRKGEIAQSYDSLSKLLGDRLPLIANQPIPSPPDFEEEE